MSAMAAFATLDNENSSDDERSEAMQLLVNEGTAWQLEGSVGRSMMSAIELGYVLLGKTRHRDYWGNTIPGRDDVLAGSKGTIEYVTEHMGEEYATRLAAL